jgi:hypothetical protein
MPEQNEQFVKDSGFGRVFFQWKIPEFTEHNRSGLWYILASIIGLVGLAISIKTSNLFFALIIILAAFIIFLKKYNQPEAVMFRITEEGVVIGNQLFSYDNLKNFYFVYDPPVKKLYFKLKTLNPDDLSIPLLDNNPLPIREKLLEYLDEDLTKQQQTVSDIFETILKL